MTSLTLGVQYNAYTPFMKDKFTIASSLDKSVPSYFQLRKNDSFLNRYKRFLKLKKVVYKGSEGFLEAGFRHSSGVFVRWNSI